MPVDRGSAFPCPQQQAYPQAKQRALASASDPLIHRLLPLSMPPFPGLKGPLLHPPYSCYPDDHPDLRAIGFGPRLAC